MDEGWEFDWVYRDWVRQETISRAIPLQTECRNCLSIQNAARPSKHIKDLSPCFFNHAFFFENVSRCFGLCSLLSSTSLSNFDFRKSMKTDISYHKIPSSKLWTGSFDQNDITKDSLKLMLRNSWCGLSEKMENKKS